MFTTIATLVTHSLSALAWLTPTEISLAVTAFAYSVGGLVLLSVAERGEATSTIPARTSHARVYKAAA